MHSGIDVTVDGSQGEGAGQILRSCLAVSVISGKSVHVTWICAGRKRSDLKRQHRTCVRVPAMICGGDVHGVESESG